MPPALLPPALLQYVRHMRTWVPPSIERKTSLLLRTTGFHSFEFHLKKDPRFQAIQGGLVRLNEIGRDFKSSRNTLAYVKDVKALVGNTVYKDTIATATGRASGRSRCTVPSNSVLVSNTKEAHVAEDDDDDDVVITAVRTREERDVEGWRNAIDLDPDVSRKAVKTK